MDVQLFQVTFVIVTYRSRETIAACLDAIRTSCDAGISECIIVDNASDDGAAEFIATHYPWVRLIQSRANLGFGRGCNLGFQHVTTPYVLFLNPDAVMELEAVRTLIAFMEQHPTAGVAAPAIRNADGSFQPAGMMTTIGTLIRSSTGHKSPFAERREIVPSEDPFQTSWIIGAAMLVRSELFRQVGGFDPRFFLYFEETDLCRRITQQGAGIWAVGKAVAMHIGGHSAKATQQSLTSNCVSEHYFRSRFYYLGKHFGWTKAVIAEAIALTLDHLRLLKYWITQQPSERVRARTSRPFLKLPQFPRDSG